MSVNVVIIDDHVLISTTLAIALRSRGVEATRSEVTEPEGLRAILDSLNPGVALVDVDLGVDEAGTPMSGGDLVPLLLGAGWRVIMFTGMVQESALAAAIAAGADGWLDKKAPFDELLGAVLAAAHGEQVMDPGERERLLSVHREQGTRAREREVGLSQLTTRENEVLRELAAGKRAALIADESVVSLTTVRAQIRSILSKLGVSSQLEAVAVFRRRTES
jgi:two-component system, NarL family, nitrate/nitrite response regulator NarL